MRLNAFTAGSQGLPDVAVLPTGFVVVWTGAGMSDPDYGIFGRRLSPDGAALGDEFRVNVSTPNFQGSPRVSSTAAGGFVVTWVNYSAGPSKSDVFVRRFGASGEA